jgi:hypothetical protein
MHARTRPSLYEQLETLPDGLTGEIIDGQLYAHPRPSGPHVLASSSLGYELLAACRTLLEWPEIEQFWAIFGGATQNSGPSAGARGVDFA